MMKQNRHREKWGKGKKARKGYNRLLQIFACWCLLLGGRPLTLTLYGKYSQMLGGKESGRKTLWHCKHCPRRDSKLMPDPQPTFYQQSLIPISLNYSQLGHNGLTYIHLKSIALFQLCWSSCSSAPSPSPHCSWARPLQQGVKAPDIKATGEVGRRRIQ